MYLKSKENKRSVLFSILFFFHQRGSQVKEGSEDNKFNLVDIQADTSVIDSFHTRVVQQQLIRMPAGTPPNIDLSLHPSLWLLL